MSLSGKRSWLPGKAVVGIPGDDACRTLRTAPSTWGCSESPARSSSYCSTQQTLLMVCKLLQCCCRTEEGTLCTTAVHGTEAAQVCCAGVRLGRRCGGRWPVQVRGSGCRSRCAAFQFPDRGSPCSHCPRSPVPALHLSLLVTHIISQLLSAARAQFPRRLPLDIDKGPLVAVGRLGLHAASLSPRDPAVPVEFGIAAQPWVEGGKGRQGGQCPPVSPLQPHTGLLTFFFF